MKKILLIAIAGLVLAGCKPDLNKKAATAQTRLVGMSQSAIVSCMGLPHRQGRFDNVDVWEYTTGNEVNHSGRIDYFGNLQIDSTTRNCTARLIFDSNNKVGSVTYNGKTGGALFNKQWKCGELVDRCF